MIRELRELGISKIVMMTGDSDRTAKAIARRGGRGRVLLRSSAGGQGRILWKKEKLAGRKVIMIGDGINDSPALSAADVGIAISEGAEIAREIADITISQDDLLQLVTLKTLSNELMKRINGNYRFVISFNLGLIILGISRHSGSLHLGAAAQHLYPGRQLKEYDRFAGIEREKRRLICCIPPQ